MFMLTKRAMSFNIVFDSEKHFLNLNDIELP